MLLASASLSFAQSPIDIKVVVVTMFERGADTGDQPGELQRWVERESLDRVHPFPQGWRDLRTNGDGVLALCTGIGTAKAAASVMALGLDPRFDLRRAYWVVAGIAGIDPEDGSLGSAAWAEWVVDGDLAHEIDAREAPPDWPTGYVPLRKTTPFELPLREPNEGEFYRLEPALVDWAFRLTKDMKLDDTDGMRDQRARYAQSSRRAPAAARDEGRHPVRKHLLARPPDERVGERLGQVSHRRQRQLRDDGHGGHGHAAVADVPARDGAGGQTPRPDPSHRQQFRSAA